MMEFLALDLGIPVPMWERTTKGDPSAVALADRHYSRRRHGRKGGQVGPPGRLLVLMTPCRRALWVSHWPDPRLALDGLDAWRCSIFRNEGAGLSSELIRAAMVRTAQHWVERPADGWVTFVEVDEVRSTNPGFCYLQAGWTRDRDWRPASGGRMVRLRAAVDVGACQK
jgi:hypothetical protein